MRMRCWLHVAGLALLGLSGAGRAAGATPLPAQFDLPRMKTSIYVGSIALTTSAFVHGDDAYTATYEAKVSPWSFWSESGTIRLVVNVDDYERLVRGETIELNGEATNHHGKPRQISARVQPTDTTSGSIKVRITAGGTKLIFNATYRITEAVTARP